MRISAAELSVRLGDWSAVETALYKALAGSVEALIREGRIPPDTQLPAERALAVEVNVSRGTVMAAYELLRESGSVTTLHGSGTVVRSEASPVSGPRESHLTTALPQDTLLDAGAAAGHLDLRWASWRTTDQLMSALPDDLDIRSLLQVAAPTGDERLGSIRLREQVAAHLTTRGLPTTPAEVLITTGAQQAISLVVQLYVAHGERAVVEDPTYPGAVEVLVAQQARISRVPVWGAGTELTALRRTVEAERPRLLYLIPSVHNPTGAVMPAAARLRLAELLDGWTCVVIDDMTLAETQVTGPMPPPLASYVQDATRVVTVGSLSKVMWDGLRVGWVRASSTTIDRLARVKSIADLGTPRISQALAEELMTDAEKLFEERRTALRSHRDLLAGLLRRHVPDWRWDEPAGGLCLWVDTGRTDVAAFARTAGEFGVAIVPASVSSASDRFPRHLRLPYGLPPATLEEGVRRLATAWARHISTPTSPCCRGVDDEESWQAAG